MAISLGSDFETAVADALGIDPATFDPGSLQIDLLNPAGDTTVRFTIHYALDTPTLEHLITAALPTQ